MESGQHQERVKDILAEIHRFPPVDTTYVVGLWHRDRVAMGGYILEARAFLKSLTIPDRPHRKFLIVGRARSGTTLLTRLLNEHSRIECRGEDLKQNVLAPAAFLDRLAKKSQADAVGSKLLSYQMVQVLRLRDPIGFLQGLQQRGFQLIHLTRGTLAQALSLTIAQSTGHYHSDRKKGTPPPRTIRLDPEDFRKRVAWNESLLAYERRCFAGVDHLAISYEDDLLPAERQNPTVARICEWIGIPPEPVSTPLKKLLPDAPRQVIENYDEVADALRAVGLGHLV